jgi:thiol-disulfide isomerase/thioredoxin
MAEGPFRELAFDAALAEATTNNKIVLIDFFTTWCGPCKRLDQTTWKDEKVCAWLAETTVALKIDAEKQAELAQRFAVTAYPTIVFVRADGAFMDRIVGYRAPEAFLADAADALAGRTAIVRAKRAFAGHENETMARAEYAGALANAGFPAEALENYLWCWDHGLEHEQSYSGVRLSFLLSDIARLGRAYPPALQALEERRDAAATTLLADASEKASKGMVQCAKEIAALNRALGQQGNTLELCDRLTALGERGASARSSLASNGEISSALIERRRYADFLALWHDAPGKLDQRIASYRKSSTGRPATPARDDDADEAPSDDLDMAESMRKYARGQIADFGGQTYEALLGTNAIEAALAVETKLTAFDPSAATVVTLIGHAKRASADEAAAALAMRALERLDGKDARKVQRALEKAPSKKD